MDAQIQKLRWFAERLRKCLTRAAPSSHTPSAILSSDAPPLIGKAPSSNSPSTLLSASAPSADALATCGKHVNNPRQRQSLTGRRVSYAESAGRAPGADGHRLDSRCNFQIVPKIRPTNIATYLGCIIFKIIHD